MIYRGLDSGIIRVMNENVRVDFINEESANQFKTIIWRTAQNNFKDVSSGASDASKKIRLKNKSGSGIQTCELSKLRTIKRRYVAPFYSLIFFESGKI